MQRGLRILGKTMEKAVVRNLPDAPNLTVTLTLAGKQRKLDRPKNELLEKPFQRIQKSAAPQATRSKKAMQQAQQQPEEALPSIALHEGPTLDSRLLDPVCTTNEEAWQHGRLLRVGSQTWLVELNPPMLDKVEVPGAAFVGLPLCPLIMAHFTDEQLCLWRWFRRLPGVASGERQWQLIEDATGRLYTPRESDAGCQLKVECVPARRAEPPHAAGSSPAADAPAAENDTASAPSLLFGEPMEGVCPSPVCRPPSPLGAAARLALTQQWVQAPAFRVLSYNILADQYAATDVAKTVLFKHCEPEFMAPEYRRPLVLMELLGFKGDIVCLQEVDEKMFTHYLQPQLAAAGYEGVYTNKAGRVKEGSALFWRTSRFSLVAKRDLVLKDLLPATPGAPSKYGHVFEPLFSSVPRMACTLQRVLTVGQLALLVPVNDPQGACRPLLVANTHLFFHYQAPHIRMMHTWVLMQEAHELMQQASVDPTLAPQLGGRAPTLLFCGDLNSSLNDGVPGTLELLRSGRVPADHQSWMFGVGFKWQKGEDAETVAAEDRQEEQEAAAAAAAAGSSGGAQEPSSAPGGEFGEVSKMVHGSVEHAHPSTSNLGEEAIPGVELTIPFNLRAADDLRTPFTNYVPGYKGLLDYVWYCPADVEVVREVPLPSQREIDEELGGPLPSRHFPSDHLPVVFDLRFKQQQQQEL